MHYPYWMGILDLANGAFFLNFINARGQKFIDSNLFWSRISFLYAKFVVEFSLWFQSQLRGHFSKIKLEM